MCSLAHAGEKLTSLVDASDGVTVTGLPSEDHLKALKKLGYPEVDEGTRPSALLSRVINCCTKRLKRLGELIPDNQPEPQPAPPNDGDGEKAAEATKSALQQKSLGLNLNIYPTHS